MRRRTKRRLKWIAIATPFILIGAMMILAANAPTPDVINTPRVVSTPIQQLDGTQATFTTAIYPQGGRIETFNGKPWYGLCDPYEAKTVQGFMTALYREPKLLQYYKDFNFARAKVIEVPHDIVRHVAYMKDGKIGVTSRAITIHKGETLITDGRITVRSYCCNLITKLVKPEEIQPGEPTEPDLNPPPPFFDDDTDDPEINPPVAPPTPPTETPDDPTETPDTPETPPEFPPFPPSPPFDPPDDRCCNDGTPPVPPADPPGTPPTPPGTPPGPPGQPPTDPPTEPPTQPPTPPVDPPTQPPVDPPVDPPMMPPIPPTMPPTRPPTRPPVDPVPEPTTLILFGTGGAALAARRWYNNRRK